LKYFDLTGKVAVITGGGTGIGRGIADGLAEAGATIVLCARRVNMLEKSCREIAEKTGAVTYPHRLDVMSVEEINTLVEDVVSKFGHIDILVNNAGVGGSEKSILKMTEDDWDKTLKINLYGVFLLSQAVVRKMVESGRKGKIINVASIASISATANMSPYCTSKAGVVQLTKVMALEWARYNIQVNAILPGYIETPMNTEFFATNVGQKIIKKKIPMGRVGKIEEMKGLGIYLASEASSFMTGSAVVIDGGQTC
jgi:NAD(P)-dependent dehydrogenase (short-subunit alcohol dehydrogenase family)